MKPVPISPPKSNRAKPDGATTGCGGRWRFVGPVEDVADGEIELEETEEEEDAQFLKCPGEPSPQELEQHRASHLPYRSWCRWCVMGRARGLKHTVKPVGSVPVIGLDYFFMTDTGVQRRNELGLDEDEELNKIQ